VDVDSSSAVPILSNLIYDNGTGLSDGILLSNSGNDNQPTPTLDNPAGFVQTGTYDPNNPNSTFYLQLFRRSGTGQPELVYSKSVTTDGNGKFSVMLDQAIAVGDFVFATATVGSNTSVFGVRLAN
jgi:hypothetical protein